MKLYGKLNRIARDANWFNPSFRGVKINDWKMKEDNKVILLLFVENQFLCFSLTSN